MDAAGGSADLASGGGGGDDSGSSPCFLTTAACERKGLPDDCDVLRTLRAFRDNYMLREPSRVWEVAQYYDEAPAVVRALASRPEVYDQMWDRFILPAVERIEEGNLEQAHRIYRDLFAFAKQEAAA